MDKVLTCMARIRDIKDANHGIITYRQIKELFLVLCLSEEEKRNVFERLKGQTKKSS